MGIFRRAIRGSTHRVESELRRDSLSHLLLFLSFSRTRDIAVAAAAAAAAAIKANIDGPTGVISSPTLFLAAAGR